MSSIDAPITVEELRKHRNAAEQSKAAAQAGVRVLGEQIAWYEDRLKILQDKLAQEMTHERNAQREIERLTQREIELLDKEIARLASAS